MSALARRFHSWIHHTLHTTGVVILFCPIAAVFDPELLLSTFIGFLWPSTSIHVRFFSLELLVVFLLVAIDQVSKQGGVLMSTKQITF